MSERKPSVFISYSHKDEEWKRRLVQHLGVLADERGFDVWDDERIQGGADWKAEIGRAILSADVAVLLVSVDFLTSRFIKGEEVPPLLRRRNEEHLDVVPVIVRPCNWEQVSWLSRLQARPEGGRPLNRMREGAAEAALASIALEISRLLARSADRVVHAESRPDIQEPERVLPTPSPMPRGDPPVGPARERPQEQQERAAAPQPAAAPAVSGSGPEPVVVAESPAEDPSAPLIPSLRTAARSLPMRLIGLTALAVVLQGLWTWPHLLGLWLGLLLGPTPPTPSPPMVRTPQALSLAPFEFETVRVDARGSVVERKRQSAQFYEEDLGGGVKLAMVAIPGGQFVMGSSKREVEHLDAEGPQRTVTVAPFFLGKFEVTQAQWRTVARWPRVTRALAAAPSGFKGDELPVEIVSWDDAVEFCARLSSRTGRAYRLPSEAEWEYAARAGTRTPFHFGETITPALVNYNGRYPYAQAAKGEYRQRTTPVGSFKVGNSFGLFDMHGNVYEWTLDPWHANYAGAPTDGSPWETGGDAALRVVRGGSWENLAGGCRSAFRGHDATDVKNINVGFRVLCTVARTR